MTQRLQSALNFNRRILLIGWIALGIIILIGTQLSSTIWAFANPMPHHWDNAEYLNQCYRDMWAFKYGGPLRHETGVRGEWDSLMNLDPARPPAYRILVAPFTGLGIQMLSMLRTVSLVVFWLTLFVIYKTCTMVIEGPSGKAAGLLAAVLVALYSEVGWSIRVFGTEYSLYLSIALTLYFLAQSTRVSRLPHFTWTGLGFALGLGVLSKLTFVLLASPPMCFAIVLIIKKKLPGLSLQKILGACVIALVMAWPFYHVHIFQAAGYGREMMQFQRHSLNKTGFSLLKAWVQLHINEGIGPHPAKMIGCVLAMTLIAAAMHVLWQVWSTHIYKISIGPAGLTAWLAVSMGLPLLLFQLIFSTSDNVRQMTPAYLPLTIAVAIAAASAGALLAWWSWATLIMVAVPALAQLDTGCFPMTSQPDDAWNWDPVYQMCQDRHLKFPFIGHVGNASQFCDPAIVYPWVRRGDWATSNWLWRPEEGVYDPAIIHQRTVDRDVLLTAPGFHMPVDGSMLAEPIEKDNAHNADFAAMLKSDPQWDYVGQFSIGIINQTEILMFVRKYPRVK